MFTGIIEEIGTIESAKPGKQSAEIRINAHKVTGDLKVGDSINTNGVCLTVIAFDKNSFTVEAVAETMKKTNLSELNAGDKVNLERAVKLNDRLGGHLVSGHVDGTGTILDKKQEGNAFNISIKAERSSLKYIIPKGSVAVDGISLTVVDVNNEFFTISVIPHTSVQTTLVSKNSGNTVNIECDLIGKYIEKFLLSNQDIKQTGNISEEFLAKHGYI